ncbi:hypothetical protein L596_027778 [Steinernema carpocapsae]|uniref:Uncharacterized protein n=1 Tax=Steinernema carpocapsae TaxID=34508 RepID=A0A4U5LWI1_STECR|nr:hypothetical protein L596_027778 [Steinernema carpocapsae]
MLLKGFSEIRSWNEVLGACVRGEANDGKDEFERKLGQKGKVEDKVNLKKMWVFQERKNEKHPELEV